MIEEVMIRMGLDQRPVTAALRGVRKSFAELGSDLKKTSFGSIISSGLGKLGIGLSIAGFAAASKAAIQFGDDINDLAETVNMSGETVQAFTLQVSKATGSEEDAAKALEKLTLKIGEAKNGEKAAVEMFQKFGMTIEDSSGKTKTNEQILYDFADAIANTEDPTVRATMAVEMLGKSGIKMVGALKDGSEGLKKFKEEAKGSILSGAELERLDELAQVGTSFNRWWKVKLGRALSAATGGADVSYLQKRIDERARAASEQESKTFSDKMVAAKKAAEDYEKLTKLIADNEKERVGPEMRLLFLKQEAKKLAEGTVELEKKRQEIWKTEKEVADLIVKREKESTEELKKQIDMRKKVSEGFGGMDEAYRKSNDARGDRSRFTLQDLAGINVGWRVAPWMRGQIMGARAVMGLEEQGRYAATLGNVGLSQSLYSRADQIRSGLTSLTEQERFPFKSLDEAVWEQAKSLAELLRQAKNEGININPITGN